MHAEKLVQKNPSSRKADSCACQSDLPLCSTDNPNMYKLPRTRLYTNTTSVSIQISMSQNVMNDRGKKKKPVMYVGK
jgi:hypothetical protein